MYDQLINERRVVIKIKKVRINKHVANEKKIVSENIRYSDKRADHKESNKYNFKLIRR